MSLSEPIIFELPVVAGRPVLRGADKTRWMRIFCEGYELAVAAGEPPGNAAIARSIDTATRRLRYRTWPRFTTLAVVSPSARTLRRWLTAPANSDPHREAVDRDGLRRSTAKTAPS